jgi:hypothetical protein
MSKTARERASVVVLSRTVRILEFAGNLERLTDGRNVGASTLLQMSRPGGGGTRSQARAMNRQNP